MRPKGVAHHSHVGGQLVACGARRGQGQGLAPGRPGQAAQGRGARREQHPRAAQLSHACVITSFARAKPVAHTVGLQSPPPRLPSPAYPASTSLEGGRRASAPHCRSRRRTSTGTPARSLRGTNSPNAVSWMAAGLAGDAHCERRALQRAHWSLRKVLATPVSCGLDPPFSGKLDICRACCSSRRPARANMVGRFPAETSPGR